MQTMLNALWESPGNPYVPVQDYDPNVVDYIRKARIVESHPQDPARLRLVAFHEPLPDAHAVRPAVYR